MTTIDRCQHLIVEWGGRVRRCPFRARHVEQGELCERRVCGVHRAAKLEEYRLRAALRAAGGAKP